MRLSVVKMPNISELRLPLEYTSGEVLRIYLRRMLLLLVNISLGGVPVLWSICIALVSSWRFHNKLESKRFAIFMSYWIPRRYREPLVGDILEDCHELRTSGSSEFRIRIHVLWQLSISIVVLTSDRITSAIKAVALRLVK